MPLTLRAKRSEIGCSRSIISNSVFFTIYAFSYSLYMAELFPSSIFYASLSIFFIFATLRVIVILLRARPGTPLIFGRSAGALLIASFALLLISIGQELAANGDFSYTSFSASALIVIPAIIALCIANTSTERVADLYMTIYLARYLLYFAISNEYSIEAIRSISWSDSVSPFESSFAHDMLVLVMYFVVRQSKVRTGVTAFFTMLALKRAAFISAPLFILFGRQLRAPSPPKRASVIALFLVGVASPFIVIAAYSQSFSRFFSETFGTDLNDFTSGRVQIYQLATHCADTSHAFGSLNTCLSDLALRLNGTTWNSLLHNDTLRVYMEVGVLGIAIYMGALAYVCRLSRPAFVLMAYTFFVLATSRLITHVSFWLVLFTAIALFEMLKSNRELEDGRSNTSGDTHATEQNSRESNTIRGR